VTPRQEHAGDRRPKILKENRNSSVKVTPTWGWPLWAEVINACPSAYGYSAWIKHRSYAGRRISLEP